MKIKKRSPLKADPLHNPGQSIDEEIDARWDKVVIYFITCATWIGVSIFLWSQWLVHTPISPYLITGITVIVIGYSVFKLARIRRDIRRLEMARDGEKAVGQYLERLRSNGAQVFHDVCGNGFNLDHVVLTPHGYYVVETKTISKPLKGQARIQIKDDQLFANGSLIGRNPIEQARAEAHWLRELLEDSTGKKFAIQPVIVFPGWFVEPIGNNKDVWVLNPKALPSFISNSPLSVKNEDVYLASYHLAKYIQSQTS